MDADFNPWADDGPQEAAPHQQRPQQNLRTVTRDPPVHPAANGLARDEWTAFEGRHPDGSVDNFPTQMQTAAARPPAAFDPWGGFDDFAALSISAKTPAPSEEQQKQRITPKAAAPANDDPWDSFGAFEQSTSSHQIASARVSQRPSSTTPQPKTDESVFFPRPQPLWSAVSSERKASKPKGTSPRPPRDENVLFDAEDVSDEDDEGGDDEAVTVDQSPEDGDDFGDFEEAEVVKPVEDRGGAVRSFGAGGSLPGRATSPTSPRPPRSPQETARQPQLTALQKPSPLTSSRAPPSYYESRDGASNGVTQQNSHVQSLLDLGAEPETTKPDTGAPSPMHHNEPPDRKPASPSINAAQVDPFGDLDAAFGSTLHGNGRPPEPKHVEAKAAVPLPNGVALSPAKNPRPSRPHLVPPSAEPRVPPLCPTSDQAVESASEADAWGDWEEPVVSAAAPATTSPMNGSATSLHLPELLRLASNESPTPPSNVPPPAVLLSLFPSIFQIAQSALLNPLTSLDTHQRDTVASHSSIHKHLKDYLTIATVLSHIIAGRKHRWKRDTRLAQSMSISQAGTKASGMKLTSLDKSESTREEREVANVVRAWKLQVGKLRAAIGAVGLSNANFPEVSEMLPVRTAQQNEGALTAVKPCVLCALKRNERVQKVDFDVEDSFREWWVEHWGHRACRDFWGTYEGGLRSK